MAENRARGSLWELVRLFLKLGSISFGGPGASIALMEQETVLKREWLTREHFLDMLATTNLVPGANAVEMAVHIGYVRAGWRGLFVAGAAFIAPAFAVSLALAWVYVRYGALPQAEAVLYGIGPAVVALVLVATYRLGRVALRDKVTFAVGATSLAAALVGVNALLVLVAAGTAGAVVYTLRRRMWAGMVLLPSLLVAPSSSIALQSPGWLDERLLRLALFFLKVGTLIFGSGMVLFAYIQDDVVSGYGWLTHQQLVDAIAVGQMTPGPVLSSATFIGYLVAGAPGAAVSTLAIFLPSFVITALISPWVPYLRRSFVLGSFLRSVNAAVIALILVIGLSLFRTAVTDVWTLLLFAAGMVALLRYRLDTLWLIGGGALLGLAHYFLASAI